MQWGTVVAPARKDFRVWWGPRQLKYYRAAGRHSDKGSHRAAEEHRGDVETGWGGGEMRNQGRHLEEVTFAMSLEGGVGA